jgi:L-ascorbate metabolism protein UlaG (beta-lactamase superfamily)
MRYLKPLIPVALMILVAGVAKAESMTVMIDHASRLNVQGVANVVVGNDKVADVTVVDSRTVYITGHQYGSTNIIITDRDGRTLFSGDVTVVSPASSIAVYRGATRTEVACAPTCGAPSGDTTNPFLELLQAAAAKSATSAAPAH